MDVALWERESRRQRGDAGGGGWGVQGGVCARYQGGNK